MALLMSLCNVDISSCNVHVKDVVLMKKKHISRFHLLIMAGLLKWEEKVAILILYVTV